MLSYLCAFPMVKGRDRGVWKFCDEEQLTGRESGLDIISTDDLLNTSTSDLQPLTSITTAKEVQRFITIQHISTDKTCVHLQTWFTHKTISYSEHVTTIFKIGTCLPKVNVALPKIDLYSRNNRHGRTCFTAADNKSALRLMMCAEPARVSVTPFSTFCFFSFIRCCRRRRNCWLDTSVDRVWMQNSWTRKLALKLKRVDTHRKQKHHLTLVDTLARLFEVSAVGVINQSKAPIFFPNE